MSRARKEAERRYPCGSKVRLSVGGPLMVVAGTTNAGRVLCRWFDGNQLKEAKFPPETLLAADESAAPAAVQVLSTDVPPLPEPANGTGHAPPAEKKTRRKRLPAKPDGTP